MALSQSSVLDIGSVHCTAELDSLVYRRANVSVHIIIILTVAVAASVICYSYNTKPFWFANTTGSQTHLWWHVLIFVAKTFELQSDCTRTACIHHADCIGI